MGTVTWDIDPRPASAWTRAYIRVMWWARDKRAFEGAAHTRARAEKLQRSGDHPPTPLTRTLASVSKVEIDHMTVWVARPRFQAPKVRVVYLHGGGYIHPLTRDYWRLVRALTSRGIEVVLPAYPLAPEHSVDDVLPLLQELLKATARQDPSLPTVLAGDSAGGALVLVLAARPDVPGLAGLVCLCPWLDAELNEAAVGDLEVTDPMLAESGLRAAGRWWAGVRDTADPLVSPVHQSLRGLPPIDLFIGDHDILRPAVDDLAAQARQQAATLHVHETPAMFHVWMTRAIPEGHRTRRAIAELVLQRGRAHDDPPKSTDRL